MSVIPYDQISRMVLPKLNTPFSCRVIVSVLLDPFFSSSVCVLMKHTNLIACSVVNVRVQILT